VAESILDRIVAEVLRRLAVAPANADLERRALEAVESRRRSGIRSLRDALAAPGVSVIAECKRASPSAGTLREPFDPVTIARGYASAGAAAISVVTEPAFFGGELGWLGEVRAEVELPVLRKDFIVDERQLYETALAGADAVLLIQRILAPDRVASLLELARRLSLEVLLEVFADEDPAAAVASGATLIGVNARDLATFTVDLDRVAALAASVPPDRVRIAESGIRSRQDVDRLAAAGYDAFLIGEHLVRSDDPGAALRELVG
jgi:indole-3-glycerol phosphate synthase